MTKSPQTTGTPQWLNGLDSIRIVLALIVMFGHINDNFNSFMPDNRIIALLTTVSHQLFCGPAAVTVFFVLSGIVIHYPNRHKKSLDVKTYLVKRLVRISLPLLVVAVIAFYFNVTKSIPVWSLYCEIIYYIVYPILFKLKVNWDILFKVTFVAVIVVLCIINYDSIQSMIQQKNINYKAYYWSYGTFMAAFIGWPCWILGARLASTIDSIDYPVRFQTLIIYRLGLFFVSCVLLVLSFHYYVGYIFTLNFFALVAIKWLEKEIIYYRTHPTSKILEFGGKFSYTLYLWHVILFFGFATFITPDLVYYPLFLILIIATSYVLYLLVEDPAQKLAKYWGNKLSKKAA